MSPLVINFIIAAIAFLFGFGLCALLSAGKRADEELERIYYQDMLKKGLFGVSMLLLFVNCTTVTCQEPEEELEAWVQVEIIKDPKASQFVDVIITRIKKDETERLQFGDTLRVYKAQPLLIWSEAEIILTYQEYWSFDSTIWGRP